MTYQLRNVVIAVVLGLLAAVLTTVYVTNYRKNVQHGQQDVGVLVAATNIPAGTSGAAIVSGHMLVRKTIPRTALVPGAISSPDQIARLVSTQDVMVGEQVTKSRFGGANELGVRAQAQGNAPRHPDRRRPEPDPRRHAPGGRSCRPRRQHEGGRRPAAAARVHYDRVVPPRPARPPRSGAGRQQAGRSQLDPALQRDARRHGLAGVEALFVVKNADPNASPDGGWALQLRPVTNAADSPENIESIQTVLLDGLSPAERARVIGGK